MTVSGVGARRKGADAERDCAAYLRSLGWGDARRYSGADGKAPGDLDAIPGVCIEVKAQTDWEPLRWLRQAEIEAAGRLPVVWAKRPRLTDPGDWLIVMRARDFFPLLKDGAS